MSDDTTKGWWSHGAPLPAAPRPSEDAVAVAWRVFRDTNRDPMTAALRAAYAVDFPAGGDGGPSPDALRERVQWLAGVTLVDEDATYRPDAASHMKPSEFAVQALDLLRALAARTVLGKLDAMLDAQAREGT